MSKIINIYDRVKQKEQASEEDSKMVANDIICELIQPGVNVAEVATEAAERLIDWLNDTPFRDRHKFLAAVLADVFGVAKWPIARPVN